MSDTTHHPMTLGRRGAAQHALLMIGLLGSGVVLAEAAPQPPAGYPTWAQPTQATNYPAPGQEGSAPPPGPYTAPQPGQAGQSGAGFVPPGYGGWPAGPDNSAGGMTREQFLKQQADRRAAMDQRMSQMTGRPPMDSQPNWPDPEQQRQAHEQRMTEMRAQHQQMMQQNWPQASQAAQAPQTAPDMNQYQQDMQARQEAFWKQVQAREQEMNRQWEQMQAQHREMRKQFEQMQREQFAQRPSTAPAPQAAQPAQAPSPQSGNAPQQTPQTRTGGAPVAPYGYPAPYGYAPWQGPGYPYGPGR